jgi:WD40 repeat protein
VPTRRFIETSANIIVYRSLAAPGKRVKAANAHKDGVNGVAWINGGKQVASIGGDAAIKIWDAAGLS